MVRWSRVMKSSYPHFWVPEFLTDQLVCLCFSERQRDQDIPNQFLLIGSLLKNKVLKLRYPKVGVSHFMHVIFSPSSQYTSHQQANLSLDPSPPFPKNEYTPTHSFAELSAA